MSKSPLSKLGLALASGVIVAATTFYAVLPSQKNPVKQIAEESVAAPLVERTSERKDGKKIPSPSQQFIEIAEKFIVNNKRSPRRTNNSFLGLEREIISENRKIIMQEFEVEFGNKKGKLRKERFSLCVKEDEGTLSLMYAPSICFRPWGERMGIMVDTEYWQKRKELPEINEKETFIYIFHPSEIIIKKRIQLREEEGLKLSFNLPEHIERQIETEHAIFFEEVEKENEKYMSTRKFQEIMKGYSISKVPTEVQTDSFFKTIGGKRKMFIRKELIGDSNIPFEGFSKNPVFIWAVITYGDPSLSNQESKSKRYGKLETILTLNVDKPEERKRVEEETETKRKIVSHIENSATTAEDRIKLIEIELGKSEKKLTEKNILTELRKKYLNEINRILDVKTTSYNIETARGAIYRLRLIKEDEREKIRDINLINKPERIERFTLSPDENFAMFMLQPEGYYKILDIRNKKLRMIVEDKKIREFPVFSPNSKKIAFEFREGGGNYQIGVINVDGTFFRRVSYEKKGSSVNPRWSADSKKIFYTNIHYYITGATSATYLRSVDIEDFERKK
ncbi:MAG: hypothetical protein ABH804_02765 [archaeon]